MPSFLSALRDDLQRVLHLAHSQPMERALAAVDEITAEFDRLGLDHGPVGAVVDALQAVAEILAHPAAAPSSPPPAAPAAPEGGAADAGAGA